MGSNDRMGAVRVQEQPLDQTSRAHRRIYEAVVELPRIRKDDFSPVGLFSRQTEVTRSSMNSYRCGDSPRVTPLGRSPVVGAYRARLSDLPRRGRTVNIDIGHSCYSRVQERRFSCRRTAKRNSDKPDALERHVFLQATVLDTHLKPIEYVESS